MRAKFENRHRHWLDDQEHVRRGGGQCPNCGKHTVVAGTTGTGNGKAQQGMWCTSCLSEWEDQYKLVGYI